ncbi:MAG: apolipoprotein N-acyltransferase, partial [Bacteroidales bacterium]|nr:apolipoprotein N-acyltransferase [Bacteroidales bacterium]
LISNLLLFRILREMIFPDNNTAALGVDGINKDRKKLTRGNLAAVAMYVTLAAGPVVLSQVIYHNYKEKPDPKEFLIIQPNIDPYSDKFSGMSQQEQDQILLSIARDNVTERTAMIIAPETFTSNVLENSPYKNSTITGGVELLKATGTGNLLMGAQSFRIYPSHEFHDQPTLTARKTDGGWYDSFNTALYLDSTGGISFYHKSKLVVGVEYLPYPKYLGFLNNMMIDLGGATGSYGTQEERYVHSTLDGTVKIGAAICYESVYGDYYRDYILNGANVMSIITNDGWWGNTPGYRQHLRYASLRAIETRRSIARSANTGISALINQRGDVINELGWWERGYLRGELNLNEKETVFVKYGDYIGRIAYVSMLLFVSLALLTLFGISVKGKR